MLRRLEQWVKEYWIELTAVLLALLGIVMLVGGFEIQDVVLNALHTAKSLFDESMLAIFSRLVDYTATDLLGAAAVLGAIAFIIWRVRFRFSNADRYDSSAGCPRCHSKLHRIHRNRLDRMLSATLLPHAHRYRCSSAECGWGGLLRPRHEGDQRSQPEPQGETSTPVDPAKTNQAQPK